MDWILLVVLLVIFGGGFWVMGQLDRFVAQCVRQTRRETKAQRPRQLELEQLQDALLDAVAATVAARGCPPDPVGMAPRGTMPGKGSIYRKCYGQGGCVGGFAGGPSLLLFRSRERVCLVFFASWYNKPAYHRR